MWKITITDEATGEILDTARIDPDRQPDHRKPVEIQVKRNGLIVGKGWFLSPYDEIRRVVEE